MTILESIILGIIQGVTEFLPISSSGHLVIFEQLFGLKVETLKTFDVALHVGTLVSILIYFWKDFLGILKFKGEGLKLLGYLVIGMIPSVAVGLIFGDKIDESFRDVSMVGLSMIFTGGLFFTAEWFAKKHVKQIDNKLSTKKALTIGALQALALIPGISRSGSTICGGLFQNLSRENAARFSFLLGAPAIFGAGILTAVKDMNGSDVSAISTLLTPILIGLFVSALVGLVSIYLLMKILKKHTLRGFGIYLFIVGGAVFLFL